MDDMYGKGLLKGLGITFKHFMNTYLEDIRWLARGKRRYYTEEGIEKDRKRDEIIERLGLKVIRFSDREVFDNLDGVLECVWDNLS